jgi:hypothetical protein
MAAQRRRTPTTGAARPPGTRPPAARRAPARAARRRSPGPARWLGPVLALAAAGLVGVTQLTPVLVDVTASTADAPAPTTAPAPPTLGPTTLATSTAAATPEAARRTTPELAGARNASLASQASVAAEGGLAIPQPPRPGRITIQPNAAVGTAPTYSQRPDACGGGGTTPRRMVPGVVPGVGTATLDWMADVRPEVLGYRVQAVSQRLVGGAQPPPVVQSVGQPDGCVPVTVTMTGLTSGVPYVFWLEEQVTSASTGVTRLVQVGTTSAVVIG